MDALQRSQLKQSEIRSAISAELDKEDSERDTATLENLTAAAKSAEIEVRAALLAADDSDLPEDKAVPRGEDDKLAEVRSRVDFSRYLDAALLGRGVRDGAEAELNQELGMREDYFPLDLLAGPAVETRAAHDGDAMTAQAAWLDRVFSQTAATNLGVSFRSVNSGIQSYPVTTAGGTPVQRGRTEAVSAGAYSFSVIEIKPTRNAVHAVFSQEDSLRLPGLADSIERDMRMAMTEKIDRTIFVGDAGANEDVGDIAGMTTATGVVESEITQANKILGPGTLTAFTGLVDGQYASMLSDLRTVISVGAYRLWETTIINAATENQTLAAFLREAGLMWTSRGDIDTASANGDFGVFVGLGRGIDGAAVAAVWNAGQLVRDPYTSATKGEVQLTLNYFWGFKVVRPNNFRRIKFVT